MGTATRVGAYLAGVAAVFGAALGAGALAGPFDRPDHHESTGETSLGLSDTADGYRLVLRNPGLAAGPRRPVVFTVADRDGSPLRRYDPTHERDLHLIMVRHDFTGFRHLHPRQGADGAWSTTAPLTTGRWRVVADFAPAGHEPVVLGTDLEVTGEPVATTTPPVSVVARTAGYTVTLTGDLIAGSTSPLRFAVTRQGRPVTDLQPYLGAAGHLVALREDDRSYLHVHSGRAVGGLRFAVDVPAADRYHLYLDFRHDGAVHTAQFALDASAAGGPRPHEHGEHGSHDHD